MKHGQTSSTWICWGSNNAEPTKLLKSIRKVKFWYFEYFDILILGNQFKNNEN